MSTKNVYSIGIPQEIRDLMKDMRGIDWQGEIRTIVEELVRKKSKERLLTEAGELRKEMKTIDAAELIREDRDARQSSARLKCYCCHILRRRGF